MNISIRKKTFLLFCSMFCSIPYTWSQTKENIEAVSPEITHEQLTPEQQAELAKIIQVVDNLYKHMLDLYQGLDTMLEQLALMIDKDVIKTENKRDLINQIRKLRHLIGGIRNDTQFNVDPGNLYFLLSLHHGLLMHIDHAVKQGFKTLPDFDLNSFITRRSIPADLSLEMLQDQIATNMEQLKKLNEQATTIGLTWYNKFFRRLSDLDYRYKVFTIGGKIVATGVLWGLYYGYQNDKFTDGILGKIFGPAPRNPNHNMGFGSVETIPHSEAQTSIPSTAESITPNATQSTIPENQKMYIPKSSGLVGNIEKFWIENIMNLRPIGGLLAAYTYRLWNSEIDNVKEFTTKSTSLIWGRLQGGIERVSAEKENQIIPTISFDDVVGLDHAKQVLSEIVNYIEDPERYDLLGMTPEKGFLLCGPSRTGKSYIAEALAGEIQHMLERNGRGKDDVRFFNIEAQLILNKGIGYILHLAENSAPCVLFIDEIDLLGLQRAGGNLELLSQFLAGLSGFQKNNPRKKVIVVAATNKPENIDEALRKSGRFGKIIHFNYPTRQERKIFMQRKLEALAIDLHNFDLDGIVEQTEHCTFEDLNRMLSAALKKAKLRGMPLNQQLLMLAFQEEILNIINKETKHIPAEELDILSAQIAGRALSHILLESRTSLTCATIRPIGKHIAEQTVFERLNRKEKEEDSTITQTAIEYGNIFTNFTEDTIKLSRREDRIKEAKVLLAGNVAEKLLLGECGYSYKPEDRQKALDIIKKVVFGGLKPEDLSKRTRDTYLEEALAILKACEEEVYMLLKSHKQKLQALAENLKKHLTLTHEHINTLINK